MRKTDAPGRHRGEQEAHYVCQPGHSNLWAQCQTPRLHARRTEVLLVRTALRTVLTDENISRVLPLLNDPQRYDAAREHSLTRLDLQQIRDNPKLLVLAANSTQETRNLLGIIIAEIQVHTKTAVICYTLPLPGDSPPLSSDRQVTNRTDNLQEQLYNHFMERLQQQGRSVRD